MNNGQNLGAFVTRDLNLKENNYKGKSNGFATRLYAKGKDGLTFASINGGKPYVENHTYSNRIICAYWEDDRYTIPQNLLADAQARLDEMAVPQRSFDCSVVDLAATNPAKYSDLDFQLFSIVGLIDQTRSGAKINHQVVERWIYPNHPEKNQVVLSTVAPRLQSQVAQIVQSINNVNSDWSQKQAAYYNTLTAAILGANGGSVRLLDTNNDGEPDTLYIADDPDPAEAQMVWRFNYKGWAASQNGYSGPFVLGATFNDGGTLYANVLKVLNINADNITSGTINAENINVTNINGQNIKDKTIGSSPLADNAIINRTINNRAISGGKIELGTITGGVNSLGVATGNLSVGGVSYGNTSFTGTLDQVGINKSDIAAINAMFVGTLSCNNLNVSHYVQIGSLHVSYDTIKDGNNNNVNVWTWY
jgi:phage-related protein